MYARIYSRWMISPGEPIRVRLWRYGSVVRMAPPPKKLSWSNIAVGAVMNMFEVTTLGQPFEVIKTQMASNRSQTMMQALKTVWSRGGVLGFYQGLIPWVCIALQMYLCLVLTYAGVD